MNGAQARIRTLVNSGIDVCFSNPGTSEMRRLRANGQPARRDTAAFGAGPR
jgi:thiamine pyrophosphate-dependent acetolactate synthase large subunit-like protein